MSFGFNKRIVDVNLCYKVVDGEYWILIMYIDDLFLTEEEHIIAWCKHELTCEFDMVGHGMMNYLLGLELWQKTNEIWDVGL
jgi:hypothetical protein